MGKPKKQKKGRSTREDFEQHLLVMTQDRLQAYLTNARRAGKHQSDKYAGRNTKSATAWKREGSLVCAWA